MEWCENLPRGTFCVFELKFRFWELSPWTGMIQMLSDCGILYHTSGASNPGCAGLTGQNQGHYAIPLSA